MGNKQSRRQKDRTSQIFRKNICFTKSVSNDNIYITGSQCPNCDNATVKVYPNISPAPSVPTSLYSAKCLSAPCLCDSRFNGASRKFTIRQLEQPSSVETLSSDYDPNILRDKSRQKLTQYKNESRKRHAFYDFMSDSDSSGPYDTIPARNVDDDSQVFSHAKFEEECSSEEDTYSEIKEQHTTAECEAPRPRSIVLDLRTDTQGHSSMDEETESAEASGIDLDAIVDESEENRVMGYENLVHVETSNLNSKPKRKMSAEGFRRLAIFQNRHNHFSQNVGSDDSKESTEVSPRRDLVPSCGSVSSAYAQVLRKNSRAMQAMSMSRDSGIHSSTANTPRISQVSSAYSIKETDQHDVPASDMSGQRVTSCHETAEGTPRTDFESDTEDDIEEVPPVHTGIGYVSGSAEDTNITGNKCSKRESHNLPTIVVTNETLRPKVRVSGLTYQNVKEIPNDNNTVLSRERNFGEISNGLREFAPREFAVTITNNGGSFASADLGVAGSVPENCFSDSDVTFRFIAESAEQYRDHMAPSQELISDVFHFLPHGIKFTKSVIIRFPYTAQHAAENSTAGYTSRIRVIYSNTDRDAAPEWVTVGSAELAAIRTDISAIVTDQEACVFLESFCLFGVVRETIPVKDVMVYVYGKFHPSMGVLKINIEIRDEESRSNTPEPGKLLETHSLRILSDVSVVSVVLVETPRKWNMDTGSEQNLDTKSLFLGKQRKATFVLRHDRGPVAVEDSYLTLKFHIKHDERTSFYVAEDINELASEAPKTLPRCGANNDKKPLQVTHSLPPDFLKAMQNVTVQTQQTDVQTVGVCHPTIPQSVPEVPSKEDIEDCMVLKRHTAPTPAIRGEKANDDHGHYDQRSPTQDRQSSLLPNPDVKPKELMQVVPTCMAKPTPHPNDTVEKSHTTGKLALCEQDAMVSLEKHQTRCNGHNTITIHHHYGGKDGWDQPAYPVKATPSKLHPKTKVELSAKLAQRLDGKDWRSLAFEFGLSGHETSLSHGNCDPTYKVLQYWESLSDDKGSVDFLIRSLDKIGRPDLSKHVRKTISNESTC